MTKRQQWLAHIAQAQKAGLSIVAYAKKHGLNAQLLYAARSAQHRKSVAVKSTVGAQTFVPVTSHGSAFIIIALPNGIELRCLVNELTMVLRHVQAASCSV